MSKSCMSSWTDMCFLDVVYSWVQDVLSRWKYLFSAWVAFDFIYSWVQVVLPFFIHAYSMYSQYLLPMNTKYRSFLLMSETGKKCNIWTCDLRKISVCVRAWYVPVRTRHDRANEIATESKIIWKMRHAKNHEGGYSQTPNIFGTLSRKQIWRSRKSKL